MNSTYTNYSNICTKFYDLVEEPKVISEFILSKIKNLEVKDCLFVGGFFLVANELKSSGLNLTLSDYSEDMIDEAKSRLPNTRAEVADLREMPFENEFDLVIIIGRVFTHMISADDSSSALKSIFKSLRPGGLVLLDNYEDTKIQKTDYFNGNVTVKDSNIKIIRDSTTELISKTPHVVNWKANYTAIFNDKEVNFSDEIKHRAFSRKEMSSLLEEHKFEVIKQGDNFDETSFYTLAKRN